MPKRAFVELSNCRIVAFCHALHVNYFYIILASRLNKGIAEDGKKNSKKSRDFILSCGIFFVSLQQSFSGRRESQRCPRCIHEKHQIKKLKIL